MRTGSPKPEDSQAGLAELVAQARDGNHEAWAEIYTQFAPGVFRFCRRAMPSREDAEDATSEVFLKVRSKLDQYDASRPFNAWLYRVAANHCWDLLRRRRVRQDLETGDVETMPLEHPDPGQLEQLIAQKSREEVRKALEQLQRRLGLGAHSSEFCCCARAINCAARWNRGQRASDMLPLGARYESFRRNDGVSLPRRPA